MRSCAPGRWGGRRTEAVSGAGTLLAHRKAMNATSLPTETLLAGSCASVASSAAIAFASRIETGHLAPGTNATSHWIHGDEAFGQQSASWKYTGVGYAIHHVSSMVWAGVYAGLRKRGPEAGVGVRVRDAVAVSALACFVDFVLTPKRLTPGFEERLGVTSIAGIYAAFAAGLLASGYAVDALGQDASSTARSSDPTRRRPRTSARPRRPRSRRRS